MDNTQQESQLLEETLNKTDLGHIINENKKLIINIAIALIVAIVAFTFFNSYGNKQKAQKLDAAFKVEQSVFTPYLEGKTKSDAFITSAKAINADLIGESSLIPAFLDATRKLSSEGNAAGSIELMETWAAKVDKGSYFYLFLGSALAANYEDNKQADKAITLLESLLSQGKELMKAKIYFDLGRLYLATNKNDKAKANFDFVIENFKDSEYAKISKLFLNRL